MKTVSVRSVTPEDSAPLRAIWHEAVRAGELDGFSVSDVDLLVDRFAIHPSGVFVAEFESEPVGLLHADAHLVVVRRDIRRRGLGRALVVSAEESLRAKGEELLLWLPDGNPVAAQFFSAIGYRYAASLWQLNLQESEASQTPVFPANFELKSISDVGIDDYVTLFNTAFEEHPTPLRITRELVEWSRSRPGYDPTMTLVLADSTTGQLIGFCRTAHDYGPGEAGEIKFVGLLPEWRGRGLGKALLTWGVQRVHLAGASGAQLNVESENENALRLYEDLGFTRTREWRRFSRSADVLNTQSE